MDVRPTGLVSLVTQPPSLLKSLTRSTAPLFRVSPEGRSQARVKSLAALRPGWRAFCQEIKLQSEKTCPGSVPVASVSCSLDWWWNGVVVRGLRQTPDFPGQLQPGFLLRYPSDYLLCCFWFAGAGHSQVAAVRSFCRSRHAVHAARGCPAFTRRPRSRDPTIDIKQPGEWSLHFPTACRHE